MGVITRSNHPDALWPGVKAWFGKNYNAIPMKWTQIFEKGTSDKYQEIIAESTGFGMATVKTEGSSISYDSDIEGYKNTGTHVVWGLGYIVTREEVEDNQYKEVSESRAKSLSFSMRVTTETVHANVLNRAFSSSYLQGDGVSLISTAHPTRGGNQSNRSATDADLSEASLEDAFKDIMAFKNARGLPIAVNGMRLIVAPGEAFNAERLFGSTLRVGTANNDINAIKSMGLLSGGVIVNPYLTDPDAWFIQTDVPDGLLSLWRREVQLEKDNDFDTENLKAKATMRFLTMVGDWRAIYGNPGS